MKKSVIAIIAITLSIALLITSTAAVVLYTSHAKVSFFTGHVESLDASNDPSTPSEAHPVLTIRSEDGEDLGDDANIAPDGTVSFPVLSNVKATTIYNQPSIWTSTEGKKPIQAPTFIIASKNGECHDVAFRIIVHGSNPSRAALRFGIDIKYYADDLQQTLVRNGIESLDTQQVGETISTSSIPLGDGNIAEGEEVTVYISVWVDKDALSKVGVYPNDDISLEAVFTSGEVTS